MSIFSTQQLLQNLAAGSFLSAWKFLLVPHKFSLLLCHPLRHDSQKISKSSIMILHRRNITLYLQVIFEKWSALLSLAAQQTADLHISSCKQYKNRPCHHSAMLYAFYGALKYVSIDMVRVHI